MEALSIHERMSYAKKFLRVEEFEAFKLKISENAKNTGKIDYILFYGTKK
jgi:hypothetical protein